MYIQKPFLGVLAISTVNKEVFLIMLREMGVRAAVQSRL